MWLAIVKFFSAVVQFVLGAVTGLLNWVREHPKTAFAIVLSVLVLVCTAIESYKWGAKKAHEEDAKTIATLRATLEEQRGEVQKANFETNARDAKIAMLEAESKTSATNTQAMLLESAQNAVNIVTEYEKRLAEERKKYKVVYVKDPTSGKDVPINFDNTGRVVCDRFSESFREATNKLVDNANKLTKQGETK